MFSIIEVSLLLYTGTSRDFVSWDMEKYLLSIFNGVCIGQVIFRDMYDLWWGK